MKNTYNTKRNVYLGRKVKDIGKKGLSNKKEFYDIINAIKNDYKKGKIKKRQALGRLLLLYRLTFKKNNSNLNISRKTQTQIRNKIKETMKEL